MQEQKLGYMTILYARTKPRVYDDYFIQEQKLGYMTIIV